MKRILTLIIFLLTPLSAENYCSKGKLQAKLAPVIVYYKERCPYCIKAKGLLNSKCVKFELIDVALYPNLKEKMIRLTGRKTVPQIFVGDRHIGGYAELELLEKIGRLDEMLQAPVKPS